MRMVGRSRVLSDSDEEETKEDEQGYRHDRSRDSADQRRLRRSRARTELIENTTRGQVVLKGREKRRRAPDLNGGEDRENGNGDPRPECSPGTSQSTTSKRPRRNVVLDLDWKLKVSDWLFLQEEKLQDSKSAAEDKRAEYYSRRPPYIPSMSQPPSTAAPNVVPKKEFSVRTFLTVDTSQDSRIVDTRSEYSSRTSCSVASMTHPPNLTPDTKSKSRLCV